MAQVALHHLAGWLKARLARVGLSHAALEVGMGHLSNTDMLEVCGVEGAPGVGDSSLVSGGV